MRLDRLVEVGPEANNLVTPASCIERDGRQWFTGLDAKRIIIMAADQYPLSLGDRR